jgi:Putative transmembrane protein (PGPGW)
VRRKGRRFATLAAGWTLVVAGGLMLFLPGPGLVVILGGLAVLGREAPWARRLDHGVRARLRLRRRKQPSTDAGPSPIAVRNVTK